MEATSILKRKLIDFYNKTDDMDEEELRKVVVYMLEVSNKNIDRMIESCEESVRQNEVLINLNTDLETVILAFHSFIEVKSLEKEFEFYLRGFDAS